MLQLAVVMLEISNPIIMRANRLPNDLELTIRRCRGIGKHRLSLVEQEEHIVQAGNGSEVNPIRVGLVDEAWQHVKIRWASRCAEHRRELGCNFWKLLPVPVGTVPEEGWNENNLLEKMNTLND